MTYRSNFRGTACCLAAAMAGLLLLASCGGGSASTNVVTTNPGGSNVATLAVNLGLTGSYVNGVFTSVQVCAPGSTSNCVTIPNVLVDTGSTGLRVLSSALGDVSLPSVTVGGNDLQECVQFVDLSYIWGPVAQADIHIAGETASAASVNVISAAPAYAVPQSCLALGASGSYPDNTVANLGANGILGVENLPQDCGNNCIAAASGVPQYFTCPSGDCADRFGTPRQPSLEPCRTFFQG